MAEASSTAVADGFTNSSVNVLPKKISTMPATGICHANEDALQDSFLNTIRLPGTKILSAKGGYTGCDCIKWTHGKLLNTHSCGESGNIDVTQSVVGGLHDHTAYRCNGILQSHRDRHDKQMRYHLWAKSAILCSWMQYRYLL